MIGPPSYRRCPGGVVVPLTCAGRPWRRLQVGSDGDLFGCVTKWQSDRRGACFAAGLSGLFRASINSLYCPSSAREYPLTVT